MWFVASWLSQLESFTDQTVVMDNNAPIGYLGGYDIVFNVLKNPRFEFFEMTNADEVMYKHVHKVKTHKFLGCSPSNSSFFRLFPDYSAGKIKVPTRKRLWTRRDATFSMLESNDFSNKFSYYLFVS